MKPPISEQDAEKYCSVMVEIKRRIRVIDFFGAGSRRALYRPTTIESACLQLRKVLELIAFASLAAHKDVYSLAYSNFGRHWHAGRLLRDLSRVNSDFYPRPVVKLPTDKPGLDFELGYRDSGFLRKEDFQEVYERCGSIMHAVNPYGPETDYAYFETNLPVWRERIFNLLDAHEIRLVNSPITYMVDFLRVEDDRVNFFLAVPNSG